ncbi:hypothetical protein [Adhaeretor mobilis]|uniref:Uncharacterized protein n=1 Tax=Adhaeretor mobilis TaxID=1930276 RepID=A0A517N0D3_9BACT|nr:hypothetical protein [Adhaeretor mobilis]QDT00596.1 hypothetical protein HG15A2_39350 [Adhaeretor mobilis]
MQSVGKPNSIQWPVVATAFALLLLVGGARQSADAREKLSEPSPQTAHNGALHYQRAILFLTSVDPVKREILQKPIWEIVTPATTDAEIAKLDELLIESRHAIRSARVGSNQASADFGLDIQQYMVSSLLPHTHSMVDLSRLMALVGIHRESEGHWQEAADAYFACLRMGRHMTHQTTLAEAFAGAEILETAYFSLGRWAVNCPDQALVKEAFDLLTVVAFDLVQPAKTMQSEANILKMRMDALRHSYPDGPWAEIVLEALGAEFPAAGPEAMQKAAQAAAIKHGIPQSAFDSEASFLQHLNRMAALHFAMANESAQCLTQSAADAIRCGEKVNRKYQDKLMNTQNTGNWDPAKIASLFAVHDAEFTVLRTTLAIAAAKSENGYPADLNAIVDEFGGEAPLSPYDGSPLVYEVIDGGKAFSLSVAAAKIGSVDLPAIKFSSAQ